MIRKPFRKGVDEEIVGGDFSHFVVTSPEAFDGADLITAWRYKPGVVRVMIRWKLIRTMITAYCRDEFLPPGTPIGQPPHNHTTKP